MRAYEVFLNGKRLCLAGVGEDGYVSAYITHRLEPNDTWIDVIGFIGRKKLYVKWARKTLRAGEEVLVKIVDCKAADKYRVVRRNNAREQTKALKHALRAQAKRLGWEIRESRKRQ